MYKIQKNTPRGRMRKKKKEKKRKEKHDTKVQSVLGMDKDNGTVKGRILSRPHWDPVSLISFTLQENRTREHV